MEVCWKTGDPLCSNRSQKIVAIILHSVMLFLLSSKKLRPETGFSRWEQRLFFPPYSMFDPMSELTGHDDDTASNVATTGGSSSGRSFASDVHSVTIHARQRTFYIDLKRSGNGMFFKVSEKSRGGQKTTIMFDAEDLDKFIEAFQEMKSKV